MFHPQNCSDSLAIDSGLAKHLTLLLNNLSTELKLDHHVTIQDLLLIPNMNIFQIASLEKNELEIVVLEALDEAIEKLVVSKQQECHAFDSA